MSTGDIEVCHENNMSVIKNRHVCRFFKIILDDFNYRILCIIVKGNWNDTVKEQ